MKYCDAVMVKNATRFGNETGFLTGNEMGVVRDLLFRWLLRVSDPGLQNIRVAFSPSDNDTR